MKTSLLRVHVCVRAIELGGPIIPEGPYYPRGGCHKVYGPTKKSSPHIAFVWGTNISEFLDPPSNSAKAKAWARARARVETRPRANARARVRDRIRARATELGLEGGNNFMGVQNKRDSCHEVYIPVSEEFLSPRKICPPDNFS